MRRLKATALLLAFAAPTEPALALDLREAYFWSLSEGSPPRLGLLDKDPALRTNHYAHATLNCASSGAQLSLEPVNHEALGLRIAGGGLPEVKLTVDEKDFDFPHEVNPYYNLHDQVWVYQFHVDRDVLQALGNAKSLKAQGTGIDLVLPAPEENDVAAFLKACAQSVQQ